MIERHDVAHRPDPHAFGARAGADGVKARRRHPAFVGTEVMLDAKRIVEAKLVAQLQLAPQLFVALMRRHARLGPDVRKMREFHRLPHARKFAALPPSVGRTNFAISQVCKQPRTSCSMRKCSDAAASFIDCLLECHPNHAVHRRRLPSHEGGLERDKSGTITILCPNAAPSEPCVDFKYGALRLPLRSLLNLFPHHAICSTLQ